MWEGMGYSTVRRTSIIIEKVCKEMNCAVMTRAIFLSHCGVRDVRHTSSLTRDQILLTTRLKEQQRSKSGHCANCATTRRTAHEVRRSCDTDKPVSTGACNWTENRQILHSAGDSQTYHSSTN